MALVEPDERGDPESPLRWTTKSLRHLAARAGKLTAAEQLAKAEAAKQAAADKQAAKAQRAARSKPTTPDNIAGNGGSAAPQEDQAARDVNAVYVSRLD